MPATPLDVVRDALSRVVVAGEALGVGDIDFCADVLSGLEADLAVTLDRLERNA